jgi:sigma-B regulation protein RsbU (phosphoserine phosphatase)
MAEKSAVKAVAGDSNLLVVDDNEDNRYTLTRRLKREGYTRIDAAENGRLALERLRAGSVDLVLLDIMMPEMNGYEVLEHMKADVALRDIPVIMISAVDEIDSVIRCIELGAEDYLSKPFNPTLLRARVGACLEKKRLRDDVLRHMRRLERDLDAAREIQLSMVPTDFPTGEAGKGFDVHATLQPAYHVGGDFYDFFWLAPDRLCLIIADVSDKGATAALHMARAKASIRYVCARDASGYTPNAAELVEAIDRELSRDNPHAMFITLLLAVVDVASGQVEWCNAGHNPPCLALPDGTVRLLEGAAGIAVGIDPKFFRETVSVALPPGATLFLYTDGVTEAMNNARELYGDERMLALLAAAPHDPRALISAVRDAVYAFAEGAPPSDDITMLACQHQVK